MWYEWEYYEYKRRNCRIRIINWYYFWKGNSFFIWYEFGNERVNYVNSVKGVWIRNVKSIVWWLF